MLNKKNLKEKTLLLGTTFAVGATLAAAAVNPVFADNKKEHNADDSFFEMSDAEYQSFIAELDADQKKDFEAETLYTEKIDAVISESDWETLSDLQIDEKLKKAGLDPIGDTSSPLYRMPPAQIESLSDAEFNKLFPEEVSDINENLSEEDKKYMEKVDAVISESDWEKLSDKEIDEKLKKAGVETFGDPKDPLYSMTPAQIDALSDAEFEKLFEGYDREFTQELN